LYKKDKKKIFGTIILTILCGRKVSFLTLMECRWFWRTGSWERYLVL